MKPKYSIEITRFDDVKLRDIPNTKPGTKQITVYTYTIGDDTHERVFQVDFRDITHVKFNDEAFNRDCFKKHDSHYYGNKLLIPFNKLGEMIDLIASGKTNHKPEKLNKIRAITTIKPVENPTLFDIKDAQKEANQILKDDIDKSLNLLASHGCLCEIYTPELAAKLKNGENPKPIDNRRELAHRGF